MALTMDMITFAIAEMMELRPFPMAENMLPWMN